MSPLASAPRNAHRSGKVEEPALQTELRTVLTSAINDLPEDYRTAFLMHDVEGLSNPEIADTLHLSLPAEKSRVHRPAEKQSC